MKSGDIVVYNDIIGKVVEDYGNKNVFKFLPCNYGNYYTSNLETITDNDIRPATHEEKIKLIISEYSWGEVVKVHCIGEYQILEAIGKRVGELHYHGYINYEDTHTSYSSLDSALVGCIGIKYEGGNGRAAMYFCRMVNIK